MVQARIYTKGENGSYKILPVSNIYEEDEKFIEANNLKLSIEDLRCNFVVYLGWKYNDENEVMVLANNKMCQDTIQEAVKIFKRKNKKLIKDIE